MREAALFTVAAVILYVVSDRLLNWIERRAGRHLEHRSLFFFAILLCLALLTFWVLRNVFEIQD
jgi:predicted PurR-regulated permease PerM